jgi:hypothetical protein
MILYYYSLLLLLLFAFFLLLFVNRTSFITCFKSKWIKDSSQGEDNSPKCQIAEHLRDTSGEIQTGYGIDVSCRTMIIISDYIFLNIIFSSSPLQNPAKNYGISHHKDTKQR